MDGQLLDYYARELRFIRESAREFARENPRVARWLAPENLQVSDPYVERLLEGFAFLTARVQIKMDAEFPRFTRAMLESVYPQYLAPIPSMAVVQFAPHAGRTPPDGYPVPRGTPLRGRPAGRAGTRCEYRTCHDVTVLPLEIADARYYVQDLGVLGLPAASNLRAALRVRLRTLRGIPMNELGIGGPLALHLCGDQVKWRLYEQLMGQASTARGRADAGFPLFVEEPGPRGPRWREQVADWHDAPAFRAGAAMLPDDARGRRGYRALREYFAMPERFL